MVTALFMAAAIRPRPVFVKVSRGSNTVTGKAGLPLQLLSGRFGGHLKLRSSSGLTSRP
jgi:hypothetical protein